MRQTPREGGGAVLELKEAFADQKELSLAVAAGGLERCVLRAGGSVCPRGRVCLSVRAGGSAGAGGLALCRHCP